MATKGYVYVEPGPVYVPGEVGHECRCEGCDPTAPSPFSGPSERSGPGHYAVSLGDVSRPAIGRCFIVTVDGRQVHRAFESLDGDEGFVHGYSEPPHACARCGDAPCVTTWRGRVEISIVPEAGDAA